MNLELDHPISPQAAIALSMCAMFVVVLIVRWLFQVISSIVFAHKTHTGGSDIKVLAKSYKGRE